MATPAFTFSALPSGSGGALNLPLLQRKRPKSGNDISSDLLALNMEDMDSTCFQPPQVKSAPSYASFLQNPITGSGSSMLEDFEISDADCSYTQGKHGLNVSFSEKVHTKLDFGLRCSVVVKLMGKPNSSNTFDFILKGLRRKWQTKSGWRLIDLPNDYFLVKFNLEEDMNDILCGGPWIIAGQTLTVRKWNPGFDPMTDVIGKMAVWVRICGLPVKYFRDFAVEKIGKILGEVVRVDPVTIGQARGKFARLCVEVDLSKPLRPFVEVESVAYNVVYEGISMICFECGCYGHSKDKCPTVIISPPAVPEPCDAKGPSPADESTMNSEMVHELDSSETPSVLKEDMGPWMLMNYRNKKKAAKPGSNAKSPVKGSRFSVLQNEDAGASDEVMTNADNHDHVPTIVKLWSSFQNKAKSVQAPSSSKSSHLVSEIGKSSQVKNSLATDKTEVRLPLSDLSNTHVGNPSKPTNKYQRKLKSGLPSTKSVSTVSKKLSFENVDNVLSKGAAGIFGHCPPEETAVLIPTQSASDNNTGCFVDHIFAENCNLTGNDNLSSSHEEEMVHE